jgi:hypothetical protein
MPQMNSIRKLKPDQSLTGALPVFVIMMCFAISWAIAGLGIALIVLSMLVFLYALFSFATWLRTQNLGYFWAGLYQTALGTFFLSYSSDPFHAPLSMVGRISLVIAIFSGILLFYAVLTKKMKWRGREVLELAAMKVEETGEEYTSRPLPLGKMEYSKQELLSFANFVRRHLIAATYREGDRIFMVPVKMGDEFHYMLRLRDPIQEETWVSFDSKGNLSVNIAQKDYLEFREGLSFDQLCDGLGRLFVEFFEAYRRGEAVRVIERMDSLKLSPLS